MHLIKSHSTSLNSIGCTNSAKRWLVQEQGQNTHTIKLYLDMVTAIVTCPPHIMRKAHPHDIPLNPLVWSPSVSILVT